MKFALSGMGYIAERHLKAIKDVGGELVAFLNPSDCVGFVDRYFPNAEFFKHEADFFNYIKDVDYLSICSPNYQHFHQIQLAKLSNIKVICEKPVVLSKQQLDDLGTIPGEVNAILQLRLHPSIQELKQKIKEDHSVYIHYSTPRGKWYKKSWKGDYRKSGGLLMNIGIHMFDLMFYLFGEFDGTVHFKLEEKRAVGMLQFEKASITFSLDLLGELKREMIVDDQKIDLTNINLHTESYREILKGRGFQDFNKGIELVHEFNSLYKHSRKDS